MAVATVALPGSDSLGEDDLPLEPFLARLGWQRIGSTRRGWERRTAQAKLLELTAQLEQRVERVELVGELLEQMELRSSNPIDKVIMSSQTKKKNVCMEFFI